jgi:hypothetical protein
MTFNSKEEKERIEMGTAIDIASHSWISSSSRLDFMGISRKSMNCYSSIFRTNIVLGYWKAIRY